MKERKLLIGSVVLVLSALLTAYFMFVGERDRQRELEELSAQKVDSESIIIEDQSRGERTVTLFFYRPGQVTFNDDFFEIEERELHDVEEPSLMARQIINELIEGSEKEKLTGEKVADEEWVPTWQTIPKETVLRQLYLLDNGTAIVDFSRQGLSHLAGGITSELAFIYSITRTLRENLPEIKRVRFVVEGKSQPTLAGHISIAEPFR